jgi:hypothetical protein
VIGWAGAITYSAVRTAGAVGMAIRAPRLGGHRWAMLGQALADASYAAFPIAYVSYGFRSALGLLWVPLWIYAAVWECAWFLRDMLQAAEEEDETALDSIEAPWKVVWGLCFVLPSLIAGGIVAFDAVYPKQWSLGGEPPPFVCTPAVLKPGDTLTLRMDTPHSGELGVFTPRGRYLYVVPLRTRAPRGGGGGTPGFEGVDQLRLSTADAKASDAPAGAKELIFADSGTYQFQLSEVAQFSLACRVQFTGNPE